MQDVSVSILCPVQMLIRDFGRTFEPKVMTFALNILPRITAREACRARRRVTAAFVRYFDAGYHKEGSGLIKARYDHSARFGFSSEDIARCEIGGLFAILGSTVPTCFWLVYHVYSNPVALEECRRELEGLVHTGCGTHGNTAAGQSLTYKTIDILSVKTECPILHSSLQEVLRFRHIGASARVVLQEEHLLNGKYRLKKGSIVMIPTGVYHSDPTAWGPTAFDYKRFVTTETDHNNKESAKKIFSNPKIRASYRPFGGGHVLCPGRHFAVTEILAFAALVILRFDIHPANGEPWTEPTIDKTPMAAALPVPDHPIEVEIRAREPRYEWHVDLKTSVQAVGIVEEDL